MLGVVVVMAEVVVVDLFHKTCHLITLTLKTKNEFTDTIKGDYRQRRSLSWL